MEKDVIEYDSQISEEPRPDKSELPKVLPVVPLRDIVIFPYMMYPVLAGRQSTIEAINSALNTVKCIVLL
ncbi:MAG: hypothetical protein N2510_06340, partial [Ignavibacteria bacterium]|nr:hypothetical protein [Ignavibacteria bacterium]